LEFATYFEPAWNLKKTKKKEKWNNAENLSAFVAKMIHQNKKNKNNCIKYGFRCQIGPTSLGQIEIGKKIKSLMMSQLSKGKVEFFSSRVQHALLADTNFFKVGRRH